MQIKRIKDPIADESIAQYVVENLNKEKVFQNMLQISSLDSGKIKTASIVRFALRYLVTTDPKEGKESLYNYWSGDKKALLSLDDLAIQSYVEFCTNTLKIYFSAIKKNFKKDWEDENSKLLTVISLNGFIIAFTRQLSVNGVNDFDFYDKIFSKWSYDFSNDGFYYTSSQYKKFSYDILKGAFGLSDDIINSL